MKMLNNIKNCWPPAPSATQTNTGYKHTIHVLKGMQPYAEPLRTLGDHEWWTGVRIATMGGPAIFRVRIVDSNGGTVGKEWYQESNQWVQLQWALPGPMTLAANLSLEIMKADDSAIEPEVSLRISFQELPDLNPADSYVFVDTEEQRRLFWNGEGLQLIQGDVLPEGGVVVPPLVF